jgi:hypothetical protein
MIISVIKTALKHPEKCKQGWFSTAAAATTKTHPAPPPPSLALLVESCGATPSPLDNMILSHTYITYIIKNDKKNSTQPKNGVCH